MAELHFIYRMLRDRIIFNYRHKHQRNYPVILISLSVDSCVYGNCGADRFVNITPEA